MLNRSLLVFKSLKEEQRPTPRLQHHWSNAANGDENGKESLVAVEGECPPKSYFRFDLSRLNQTGSLLQEKKKTHTHTHYVAS